MKPKHDWTTIQGLRERGWSWAEIAASLPYETTGHSLRSQFNIRKKASRKKASGAPGAEAPVREARSRSTTVELEGVDLRRVRTLEDLLKVLEVDSTDWRVSNFKGNAWEQNSVEKGRVTLLQVKANFERNREAEAEMLRHIAADLKADMLSHEVPYEPVERANFSGGDPVCAVVNIMDPHIGLMAWGRETGGHNQDLKIAISDYDAANQHLLAMARVYPVEQIIYVVGHDLMHADKIGFDKGATTANNTGQDLDTRLDKIFTETRQAVIRGIDRARLIAPVRVQVVPGNHDPSQMYRLGEVITAWYRSDPEVDVFYSPAKRSFWSWGNNAWMFTHGEEFARLRDNIITIFATECPAEMWVGAEFREILTGHNHRARSGRYVPTMDLDENRSIRTRSLPGLTATDAWHAMQGYKHARAATLLAYRKSGGIAGLHEFNIL